MRLDMLGTLSIIYFWPYHFLSYKVWPSFTYLGTTREYPRHLVVIALLLVCTPDNIEIRLGNRNIPYWTLRMFYALIHDYFFLGIFEIKHAIVSMWFQSMTSTALVLWNETGDERQPTLLSTMKRQTSNSPLPFLIKKGQTIE